MVLIRIGVSVHLRIAILDRCPSGTIGLGREFNIGLG
jgi:hypothetical protein